MPYNSKHQNLYGLFLNLVALGIVLTVITQSAFGKNNIHDSAVVSIDSRAFRGVTGRLHVNQSSGDANGQLNLAAVAFSANNSNARATVNAVITVPANVADITSGENLYRARIEGLAFSLARGLVSVNQVGGSENRQINSTVVAAGSIGEVVTMNELSTVAAERRQEARLSSDKFDIGIDSTAFKRAKGLVQINQIAGNGNLTANKLSIGTGFK